MQVDPIAAALLTLGGLFLAGLLTDLLGRRTPLPRVTLLLLIGFAAGPVGLDLLPPTSDRWFPLVANVALVMVGFLLGGGLTLGALRKYGRAVLGVSLSVVCATALVVFAGLAVAGAPLAVALLLAAVSTSTDPLAVSDVVRESRAEGRFTRTLLGVVVVDDAWGLILFSALLALVVSLETPAGAAEVLRSGAWELGGAVAVGIAIGLPMALLTGRLRPGEPTQAEALGGVLLCGGIALWLEVSFLLAAMVMGAVVANLARHHRRPFRAIEGIEWPFMILFFVLSGASVPPEALGEAGALAGGYLVLRVLGRALGGWGGGRFYGSDPQARRWLGLALLPQAGVALGMALVVSQRFPDVGGTILPAIVATTVLFEVVGPVLTRRALVRVGEAGQTRAGFAPEADRPR